MAAAGVWNSHLAAGHGLPNPGAMPMTGPATGTGGTGSTSSGSDSSSGDSATISANDFLTLLVTEMKNQDPTADTDPNEYINQLVQVNSLEQLIDINQTLAEATSAPPTRPCSSVSSSDTACASVGTSRSGLRSASATRS